MKKIISFFLVFVFVFAITAVNTQMASFMASPTSGDQITSNGYTRYYNKTGAEVTTLPVLGDNAVVSVSKTIEGTENENEFAITLDVKTSLDISEVEISPDAAVVLVLDISGSMSSPTDHMPGLRTAANNFLDSFAKDVGDAKRYVALVTFSTNATIRSNWVDITDPTNLANMKTLVTGLQSVGSTNMEGGLQLARNLFRTPAFPKGEDNKPIENRSVVLFTDGEANTWATNTVNNGTAVGEPAHNSTQVAYDPTTMVYGGAQYASGIQNDTVLSYTVSMANVLKNDKSFVVDGNLYAKQDASLYTIGFGSGAPTTWLKNSVATNPTFAYAASNASDLNNVFAAIVQRIESWAEAWVVTDPMNQFIEFTENISQSDLDSGLLKFESNTNTLSWDVKKATPISFQNDIYSYRYTYHIKLDTTSGSFQANTPYPTNGETKLTYVMLIDGKISSDVMPAYFAIPAVEGYRGSFGFTKVGADGAKLANCGFLLQNQTVGATVSSYGAYSADNGTGAVSFVNIPSGHVYKLTESHLPPALTNAYKMSTEEYTVTVSYGVVTIKDSQNNIVGNGFQFVNPLNGRQVTGLVWPMVVDDLGLGDEFLAQFDIVVELRATFSTPASGNLKTTTVATGNGSTGQFTFDNVPVGEYVLYIKRPGYLVRCLPVSVSSSSPNTITLAPPDSNVFMLWGGDVNDDFLIDVSDLSFIINRLNVDIFDTANYLSIFDLNGDGIIDMSDLAMVLGNLGLTVVDYPGAENVDFVN